MVLPPQPDRCPHVVGIGYRAQRGQATQFSKIHSGPPFGYGEVASSISGCDRENTTSGRRPVAVDDRDDRIRHTYRGGPRDVVRRSGWLSSPEFIHEDQHQAAGGGALGSLGLRQILGSVEDAGPGGLYRSLRRFPAKVNQSCFPAGWNPVSVSCKVRRNG